jgi:hypothetical protein
MEKTYKYKAEKYKAKYLLMQCNKCKNCKENNGVLSGGAKCQGCNEFHHMCSHCKK